MAQGRMRSILMLSWLLALGACAGAPDDGLLASTPIVRELWREWGDVVEVARFSRLEEGEPLPYAMLIYVWANEVPVDTVLPNPHLDRIRMIVVESGDIVAVGVLTDSDNTQQVARAQYGDITFRAP
jgi:hypothetical protein